MPVQTLNCALNRTESIPGYLWSDEFEAQFRSSTYASCNMAAIGLSDILISEDFSVDVAAAVPAGSTINQVYVTLGDIGSSASFACTVYEVGIQGGTYSFLSNPNILLDTIYQDIDEPMGAPTRAQLLETSMYVYLILEDSGFGGGQTVLVDHLALTVDWTPPTGTRSGVIGGGVGRGIVL